MGAVATEQSVIPAGKWLVDPVHSSVTFQVEDTSETFSTISGRFTDFEGTLEAGADLSSTRVHGVIRAASIATDQEQRDAHLRSGDFFDADTFPEIRFESKAIDVVGDETVAVRGELSIKDLPQEVVLTARVQSGQSGKGDERLIFTGSGEVAWGPMTVTINAAISAAKEL